MIINKTKIKLKRFSSKELKLIHSDLKNLINNNTVEIIYKGEETIFELMICCSYYKSINTKVILYLSYLPYQRMDHNNGHEAPTLEYVAEFFNSLELESLKICEPHCNLDKFKNAQKIDIVGKIFDNVCKQIGLTKTKTI